MKYQNLIYPTFILLIFLAFGPKTTHAQEFRGSSPSIQMDFGFPELKVMDDIEFVDEDDDFQLSAGEAMLISFSIQNNGEYAAKDVMIQVSELNGTLGIDLPEPVEVGEIKAGERKLIQIGIGSDEQLKKGTASFVFQIMENGEVQNLSVPYVVNTKP